ncbi:hypothetical protein ACQY0O_000434 [Thecaphora frezii]
MSTQGRHYYDSYSHESSAAVPPQPASGSAFYSPYTPSPGAQSRPSAFVQSPAASSYYAPSSATTYFTPPAVTYHAGSGSLAPPPLHGHADGTGRPSYHRAQSGASGGPHAHQSDVASASVLSPQLPPVLPYGGSLDRDKEAGKSIAKSSETRGSRAAAADSWIRLPSRRAGGLLLTVIAEAMAVIVLAGIVFGRITSDISNEVQDIKTVSVYLAIFVFGMIFQVAITLDALRLKNTIQVIGVCIFNVALAIAAGLEITQVRDALHSQDTQRGGIPCPFDEMQVCRAEDIIFPEVHRLLIGVTVICAAAEIPILFWTAKLWTEFGWIVYQKIGADLRIRSMFMWYQTFIVLLKFTFFFGVGFTIFYLILVADTTDWEYGVTIAAVPIAVVALFAAAFAVRREIMPLMVLSLFLMVAGLVYFVYKLTQVWVPATRAQYEFVRLTITFISAFAIISLALTLANGLVCLLNFQLGLKQAHDSIGQFGGVRRRRVRDRSDAEALDLDRNIDFVPGALPQHLGTPSAVDENAHRHPRRDPSTNASSASHGYPSTYTAGVQAQQTATRISLD